MKHKRWPIFLTLSLITLFTGLVFVIYCISLFKSLDQLIQQTPEFQPTTVFSDLYEIKKNSDYLNSFLEERLHALQITETVEVTDPLAGIKKISWQPRGIFTPPELLSFHKIANPIQKDSTLSVIVHSDLVQSVLVNSIEVESIYIEPTPVSRITGNEKSIREYLKLSEVPNELLQAIIAIEDQRFLEHTGFDPRSLARALWTNLRKGRHAQGGSTLTQQLVKNLLGNFEKTYTRKLRELILAILIEFKYSKEKILEKYLNEVYFGQVGSLEIHGVSEAAHHFYNKKISDLRLDESALLAGLIQSPVNYSPFRYPQKSIERRNTVLKKMLDLKIVSLSDYKIAISRKLELGPVFTGSNKAHYFVDYVKAYLDQNDDIPKQGLQIYTTLDLSLQRKAESSVFDTVIDVEKRLKLPPELRLEGVLVAADHEKGLIKALVGGRSFALTNFNRVTNMKRQVGSLFKPITYLSAFIKEKDSEGRQYSPTYQLIDEPMTFNFGNQIWSPQNYDKKYRGTTSLREAFINSINIPVAKIGLEVGLDKIIEVAKELGISTPLQAIPSLSLGSIELSPLEMLQTYSTIANRGKFVELKSILFILDSNHKTLIANNTQLTKQTFSEKYFDLLNFLLNEVTISGTAQSLSNGIGGLKYAKKAFGKTGTTNQYRDTWFAGFSEGVSAISWIGFDEINSDVKAKWTLTGATGGLPLWARFFQKIKPSPKDERTTPYFNLENISEFK